ncbi:hypothetical protein KTO58_21365 [Chitinophaga pendula]|uniref:hypothetical protein n=1 Tax=Chitinophaga TaxID=79328 RepID=UPI000BAF7E60|nr:MULTISPECIES: hypothetical protein [Chitinophaga]ASZ10821.1 hypothetical protein CK934_07440 [Chitinophaga sp. MD30]UCJ06199.1 hypothetical protein KTO58_21365 [Chitinophaga pendula]
MNKKPLVVTLMSTAVLGMMLATSCKKDNTDLTNDRTVSAAGPSGPSGSCPDSTITGVITANLNLKSCRVYKLQGLVYVANNATLTIEPGTTIKGIKGAAGQPGGGLIITRGSKLIAQGTETDPIIFTSNEAVPASGDWSGIVLLGKAPTNHPSAVIVEGITNNPPADATYGGPTNNDPNDNSGILKYVRIEYAGYELATDNELNGLTLAGVGKGTTLDYIEVYKSNDDAFEFFGGTVDASHLLAIDALDDLFDTDNGYSGKISYALGVSDLSRADKSQSNGFESDNNANGDPLSPYTHPTYEFVTIVGQPSQAAASITNGAPSTTGRYGRAAHLRRNAEFAINRSIFLGFNYGISLDTQRPVGAAVNTKTKYDNGISTLTANFVQAFILPYATEVNGSGYTAITPTSGNAGFTSANPNANIGLNNPFGTTRTVNNYIPNALSSAKAFGAFPTGSTTWANGWSRF